MALTHDIVAALQTQGEIKAVRDLVASSQQTSFDPEEMQNRVIYVHTPGLPNQAMKVTLTPISIRCPVDLLHMCAQNIIDTWFKGVNEELLTKMIQILIENFISIHGNFKSRHLQCNEPIENLISMHGNFNLKSNEPIIDLITELGENITLSDTDTLDFHSVYTSKHLVNEIQYQPFHVKEKAFKMGKEAKNLFSHLTPEHGNA